MDRLILKKVHKNNHMNIYGWDCIQIIGLNYDGNGCALALTDGELTCINPVDLDIILFGDGIPIYQLERRKEKISMILDELQKQNDKPL
jgi:predicted nicotinamide N-methyase